METVIEVHKVTKVFEYLETQPYYLLRDSIVDWLKKLKPNNVKPYSKPSSFTALNNISLNINKGETLGIIGPNGAGKSTFLKILSRITPPSSGEVKIHGRVTSLLEVGTGFNPELTGRENVFLNGALLGMGIGEIKQRFAEITDFADIGKFLDTPVKHYSSGMYIRLAFAIAANLNPEILIIDEVLAVGDLKFQKKSYSKIKELASSQNTTVILVTHNLEQINQLCTRCIVLEKGKLVFDGKPAQATGLYSGRQELPEKKLISSALSANETRGFLIGPAPRKNLTKKIHGSSVRLLFSILDSQFQIIPFVKSGAACSLQFECQFSADLSGKEFDFGYNIEKEDGTHVAINYLSYSDIVQKVKKKNILRFQINKFPLAAGNYVLHARFEILDKGEIWLFNIGRISVSDGDFYIPNVIFHQDHSPVYIDGSWSIK